MTEQTIIVRALHRDEIDRRIEEWHNAPIPDRASRTELWQHLGWTRDEYAAWVGSSKTVPTRAKDLADLIKLEHGAYTVSQMGSAGLKDAIHGADPEYQHMTPACKDVLLAAVYQEVYG